MISFLNIMQIQCTLLHIQTRFLYNISQNNQNIMENKKCFRNIYAPHGAKFRLIFSVEAKPVRSKYARDFKNIQCGQHSCLTLTFKHVTWNLLRATPAPSVVLIKWRGQKILSGQLSGLKRVVWPWPLNMWPWKAIAIIYSLRATPAPSLELIK